MKLDRLMGILTALLQNDCLTMPALAARFEVSRRTIARDIDALCRAGIPVVTRQGGGGGVCIAQGYKLDKSVLTADERISILAALKGLGSVSRGMEQTVAKLQAGSPREPIQIDLASYYKDQLTDKIARIKQAILDARIVAFAYYSENGQSHRRIEPYCIRFQWSSWYVYGYCLTRADFRLFKLTCLRELVVCEQAFTPRDISNQTQDSGAGFPDDHTLVAEFDADLHYRLVEANIQEWQTLSDGRLRLSIGYTNPAFIVSWLLGFGGKARVLEPADIAAQVLAAAKNIVARYE